MPSNLIPSQEFFHILRYPQERKALVVTLGALVLLVLISGLFSLGTALLLVLFTLWAASALVRISHRQHIGNALRVSSQQFPELVESLSMAARAVGVPPVQVFVYYSERINAYAFGWSPPQAVVLTSRLVEAMDADEFRFVVGHEMGHVALGHTRLGTLVGGILGAPRVPVLSTILVPIFLWWSRCAEYSADRAGVIACGQLDKSVSALLKVMVGPQLASKVNVEQVLAQSQELMGKADALAGEVGSTHPFLVHRLRELVKFWNSEACQSLLAERGAA